MYKCPISNIIGDHLCNRRHFWPVILSNTPGVQQFRRIATEQNPDIQMILPLADIVGMLQQGVGNLLRETGRTDSNRDGQNRS